jgi:hypothetical protein
MTAILLRVSSSLSLIGFKSVRSTGARGFALDRLARATVDVFLKRGAQSGFLRIHIKRNVY